MLWEESKTINKRIRSIEGVREKSRLRGMRMNKKMRDHE